MLSIAEAAQKSQQLCPSAPLFIYVSAFLGRSLVYLACLSW